VLKDDARMNLEAGRYQLAEDEVHRALAIIPEDPDALYLLGKIRLARAESDLDSADKLREAALGAFLRATEADPDFAPPYREMGLLEFQQDYPEEACHNFLRYLELDPKAEDAPRIRDYVLELRSTGHCP
jgi:tetratricopeptide (TPR) repeat protein